MLVSNFLRDGVARMHYRVSWPIEYNIGGLRIRNTQKGLTMKKFTLVLAAVLTAASLGACAGKAPIGKGKGKSPAAPVMSAPIAVRG